VENTQYHGRKVAYAGFVVSETFPSISLLVPVTIKQGKDQLGRIWVSIPILVN
jgi:hypothetical protein